VRATSVRAAAGCAPERSSSKVCLLDRSTRPLNVVKWASASHSSVYLYGSLRSEVLQSGQASAPHNGDLSIANTSTLWTDRATSPRAFRIGVEIVGAGKVQCLPADVFERIWIVFRAATTVIGLGG